MHDDDVTAHTSPQCPLALVEELNHRVINQYAEAISMLSAARGRNSGLAAEDILTDVANRLRNHGAAHRALLPPIRSGPANLTDYLNEICSSFAKATLADSGVDLLLQAEDVELPAESCWRVGMMIAELVRNAARHGLGGKDGTILVRVAGGQREVSCIVYDSGQARSSSRPGRGQQIIRSPAADLGGTVAWSHTSWGTLASLRFPKSMARKSNA